MVRQIDSKVTQMRLACSRRSSCVDQNRCLLSRPLKTTRFRKPLQRKTKKRWFVAPDPPSETSKVEDSIKTEQGEKKDVQKSGISFQEAISKLEHYWSSVGCAVWLPHNTEVTHRFSIESKIV